MDENIVNFQNEQDKRWIKENNGKLAQILWMINNKDKFETKSYDLKSIENIQRLRQYLDRYITDEYAVLISPLDQTFHLTIFHINDRERFLQEVYSMAIQEFGSEALFKVDLLTLPISIMIHNREKKLTLTNYSGGVIKC